nr:hypothetical protein [Tanacetum cinerariifolium]
MFNIFNDSSEDFLEDLFSTNQPSGNPTFSSHLELTSPEVNNDIFDSEGCNVLSEKLLDLDSTKDIHPPLHDNPLSGRTTYFYSSNPLHEELTDELAVITYVDSIPEMFTDELALDYSSPPIFDEYDDDFLEVESDAKNVYDDPFNSKGEKIKESKLLIDKLDLPCDFLPPFEYDSFISQDFSKADALPSTNNEDKIFNPWIHTSEKVHSSFIPELSHQGYKVFKINQIFKSLIKIFLFYFEKDTHILAVPCHHFYPLDQFKYRRNWVKLSDPKQALRGRKPMLIRSFVF